MTNISAFLLVLTLTGSPVASVVCVTECQHEPATSGHCHADMGTSDGSMISAGFFCNDPSIGNGPYVTEQRAVSGAAVLATTSFLTTPELVRTDAPADYVSGANALLRPLLVLRI